MSKVTARRNVPEGEQAASFQNATLQGDDKVAFSIATFIDLPEGMTTEGEVYDFLIKLLGPIATDPTIHFVIEVGPAEEYR